MARRRSLFLRGRMGVRVRVYLVALMGLVGVGVRPTCLAVLIEEAVVVVCVVQRQRATCHWCSENQQRQVSCDNSRHFNLQTQKVGLVVDQSIFEKGRLNMGRHQNVAETRLGYNDKNNKSKNNRNWSIKRVK